MGDPGILERIESLSLEICGAADLGTLSAEEDKSLDHMSQISCWGLMGWRRERPLCGRESPPSAPPRRGCPGAPSTPLRAAPARSGIPGEPRHRGGGVRPGPGGRRQAASPLKAASAAPRRRRRRRRRRSPRPAAPRCARLALRPPLRFPHPAGDWQPPPDIGRHRLRRPPGRPRGERLADYCGLRGTRARRLCAGWSTRPCAPLRRGLGCPGRAGAEDRRAERRGAGSRPRAPRCRSPPAGARGPGTCRPRCDRTPGWPQRAQRLGPGARRARGERGHPLRRPETRLDSLENAPEDAGAPEPRWFQLASANGGALEEGRVMRGGNSPGTEIAAAPFPGPGVSQDGWPEPWPPAELAPSARPSPPESRSQPPAGPRVPRALVPKEDDSTSFSFLPSLPCSALLPLLAVVVCQHLAGDFLNLQGE
ncbi:basic proline-rich protein-like [Physeter macrocephalus]|uniref:Basic proline-rich protein-like n=1 Tax=Physeter macrocephalus TaxID=9755 RepID=A0A9W2X2P2_PHYMC|nr:basic proline-rich protein-like [Physeter catodon]